MRKSTAAPVALAEYYKLYQRGPNRTLEQKRQPPAGAEAVACQKRICYHARMPLPHGLENDKS